MALDDADLSIKDMQAMYCGNLGHKCHGWTENSTRNWTNWNSCC